jgi:hypothetical protein
MLTRVKTCAKRKIVHAKKKKRQKNKNKKEREREG